MLSSILEIFSMAMLYNESPNYYYHVGVFYLLIVFTLFDKEKKEIRAKYVTT